MANNVTDRAAATAAAGTDSLFPMEVSLGETGAGCREWLPTLGTDEFAEQCRSLDHRPPLYRFVKRLFDLVFSACVIAVGFIPGLILSLVIVADTKGSPIYSQARVGRLGRTFRIYKFRTMVADSDDVEKYLDAEQLAQWHRERKVDNDPRITPLGRKLRRLSLDEVPNFLNVLKGDMSVIGPRAVSCEEIEWFGDDAETVLSVPAGITGLWQATRRNDATFESGERQRIELEYAKGAGFAMDFRCFIGTFGVMFGKKRTGR
ncbi:sugar transferase [Collinsella intestinalis]|uniref:sugar transferase n=1 Tax=Collinsella intestinalis TaxID=147207 RepID=UPI00195C049A|nr:sugar transferase [Collinsella intestinalis]MBM6908756.1 sugar transferase [Collinsella intestinalis]